MQRIVDDAAGPFIPVARPAAAKASRS